MVFDGDEGCRSGDLAASSRLQMLQEISNQPPAGSMTYERSFWQVLTSIVGAAAKPSRGKGGENEYTADGHQTKWCTPGTKSAGTVAAKRPNLGGGISEDVWFEPEYRKSSPRKLPEPV
jgi:hypothetical protein